MGGKSNLLDLDQIRIVCETEKRYQKNTEIVMNKIQNHLNMLNEGSVMSRLLGSGSDGEIAREVVLNLIEMVDVLKGKLETLNCFSNSQLSDVSKLLEPSNSHDNSKGFAEDVNLRK